MDAGSSAPSSSLPRPLRVVLCPWLALGHLLPFLELAERLASRGHRVSFVSTPRNLARLPPRRHAGSIDLVPLPLPRVESLPDGAESTNDVPSDRLEPLWEAFDGLAAPFAEYLHAACAGAGEGGNRPDWCSPALDSRHLSARRIGRSRGPGSEVPLRVELVHELAHGLELAGTRFLWALRKPRGVADADVLPAGFQERTDGRGLVAMGWVPQTTVLAHAAVGAFLTHCGRSSLTEGLLHGHPLIMLPIFGDQEPNARLMAGRMVGLQVARNEDDGSFDRHGVARAVRAVMVEEDIRRVLVANAMKMQEIVADEELQERYIDEFVQKLRSYITDDGTSCTPAAHSPA
ncbi:soyasaponin III rhamnosyltransferase-like [Panicum virgatum]|uniref:soyasaponin III rhamnosyltransferase-like n=1 Tax=Panicum virgatum TaxID=38727 RepID=UPI0019D5A781|nr:soyasaponin III rhamnosyltransferase-like [Panicum virgatum]